MNYEILLDTLRGFFTAVMVFMPGFFLANVLFKGEPLPWKIGASFGITVMIIGGIALLLSYTSFGIRYMPIITTLFFVDMVTFILFVKTNNVRLKSMAAMILGLISYIQNNMTVAFGWILLILVLVCVPNFIHPKSEYYTEFFFADGYFSGSEAPWRQEDSRSFLDIAVGIHSYEATIVTYELRITDNEQEIDVIQLGEVQPGTDLKQSIRLPGNIQSHDYRFLLYKDNSDQPYRQLSFSLGKS